MKFKKFLLLLSVIVTGPPHILLAQAETDKEKEVDEIVVIGRAQRLYRVREVTSGKIPTEPLNSTHIIATINKQLIEDQGARDAGDLYRNIAGVSLFSYAGVTARGFRQEEIFFDGLRGDPYIGFNVPQLFNVERVEFLKGPAGMLYGQGAPGGLFNYVTKKPSYDFSGVVKGIVGTEARYGGSLEITGPIGDAVAGRLGVFYEDRNTPRVNSASRVTIYDAGLSFNLSFAELILQATRYEQDLDGNRLRGVPVDDEGNFLTDRRWNHNEKTDFLNLRSNNFQVILKGEIGRELTWDATLRHTNSRQAQDYHEPRSLIDIEALLGQPTDGSFDLAGREFRRQSRKEEQSSFGANLIWERRFSHFDNRLLLGYEYFQGKATAKIGGTRFSRAFVARFLKGTSKPGDIIPLFLNGSNYGQTNPKNYRIKFRPERINKTKLHGLYALNEVSIGRFIFVGGVRFDRDRIMKDDHTSFRVGSIYKLRENIALFTQFADSYTPQTASNQNPDIGGPFDPVTGTILEGGVKAELFDGGTYASLALYQIKRKNILQDTGVEGSAGRNLLAPLGEVTSKGIELELKADMTPNWVFTAFYAYNDTRITKLPRKIVPGATTRGFRNSVGERFANAPEHQFGFWTRYQVPAIKTAFALGGDYVGDRLSLSGQKVKSYFIFDASIIWNPGPFDVLLRVDNIFDTVYAESGFLSRTGHFPGHPRSIFLEISKKW